MKRTLTGALVLMASLAWAEAPATGVQAVPSDEIKYPDASQVLNKPDAKAQDLPVTKLVTVKPVPAQAAPAVPAPATGWYLKWSLADEASARSWAGSLGVAADVSADGPQWQVLVPASGDTLKLLGDQAGKAVLVRR